MKRYLRKRLVRAAFPHQKGRPGDGLDCLQGMHLRGSQCSKELVVPILRNEATGWHTRSPAHRLKKLTQERGSYPLFVGASGARVSRTEVVQEIENIARRMGYDLLKPNGRRVFGGHCFRISGAVFTYSQGAEDSEVCELGGWHSKEQMKRYLRGVPFCKVATITNRIASSYDGIPSEAPHRRRTARQQALPDRKRL